MGMMSGKKRKNGTEDLRRKAEERIPELLPSEELPVEEVRRLVHELRVHQIELEVQNDALRETQAELVKSNSRFTDLYDFAPVGYLTIDEKFIILQANLTLARQLETERGSLVGRPFTNFIAQDERGAFRSRLTRIFENRGRGTLETRLSPRGGESEFPAQLVLIFAEDARAANQCRVSVTDISELKKAQKAAEVYMKKLEQSNKELQEFAFIASHDLQEPLGKVRTFGNRIEEKLIGVVDDETRDYLDRMLKATKRMSEMIEGLLNYSRVGTKEGKP
jgi:PAS domain S-box-containing protein